VDLMPSASQQVTVIIDPSASNHPLSFWVPANDAPVTGWGQGTWTAAPGDYIIHVGTSSADTPLEQTIAFTPVDASECAGAQPGPGWVCVNGNWVPPGQMPADGESASTSNQSGGPR
jgi:hypothetical protein